MRKIERDEPKKTRSLVLSDRLYTKAKAIGRGSFTLGIKKALEHYNPENAVKQFTRDQRVERLRLLNAVRDD